MMRLTASLRITACATLLACASISASAWAQDQPVGLIADTVDYDPATDTLTATGNVTVVYQNQTLTTDKVIFNQSENRLTLPGPVIVTDSGGASITANSADLDIETQQGLIQGAKLLLEDQFQLAAQEITRVNGQYKVLTKVVGSTCTICADNPTPFWQIRAKRVIHDEVERRLYFEKSTLDVLGVPIVHAPYLSTPDPSVTRATGYLVPEISQSNTLGYGVEIPYYIVINDHADVTLKPFISTEDSAVLGAEYRQKFRTGEITFEGATAFADPLADEDFRSYIKGSGEFQLPREYQLSFGVHLASDDEFKSDYGYGDEDRLRNFLRVEKTKPDRFFAVGGSFTQSLRPNEVDQNIPLALPDLYVRKTGQDGMFGGNYGITGQTIGLIREGSTLVRAGLQADWTKTWRTQQGFVLGLYGQLGATAYATEDYVDPRTGQDFGNSQTANLTPLLAAEMRYPLMRRTGHATHVLEPIVQLVWSDDDANNTPNEDAAQAEFEATNLFSTNRFPGLDGAERGLRANIGVNYTRYTKTGWEVSATVGRVFRQRDLGQFPASVSAGLTGDVSDYVGAISLRFPNQFELVSRSLMDSNFDVSKNETLLAYKSDKVEVSAAYVWLDQNVVLSSNESQHELRLNTAYQGSRHWLYTADWRHNLEDGDPIEGEFGLEYENECAKMNFSLSLDYDSTGNVTREFKFKLSLEGLGDRRQKQKFARRCAL